MDCEIISTGSKGNCVVINGKIAVDMGVPFHKILHVYKGLRLVLLTHAHGDHFRPSTVRRLARERPTLRFGCCEWLVSGLLECGVSKGRIDVYDLGISVFYGEGLPVAVEAFPLRHDALNCGYRLHVRFGAQGRVFYATDTNSLDGIEAKGYDLYMVEANYGEVEILERIRRKQETGEYCHEWGVLENHLSREKAEDWLYKNMGPGSRYILLHEHEERSA